MYLFLLSCLAAQAGGLPGGVAAPDWDVRFRRTDGWIGGDGAYSVAITPEKTLWLFSDTFVGKVRDGKRTDATMVNNTLAIQQGHGASAQLEFVVRRDQAGKAMALITPADGHGWFWLHAGIAVEGRLYLFLMQIEKAAGGGAFGFKQVGQWLAVVANPLDHPTAWRVEQKKLPFAVFEPKRQISFGVAALRVEDAVYIYGTDDEPAAFGRDRYWTVARAPSTAIADFTAWRFYAAGKWVEDFRQASRLASGMGSEGSVQHIPKLGKYLCVYTENGLSDRILARTAPDPWGPWSQPEQIFRCLDGKLDKRIFCYAGKAHPAISSDDELLVSYATNSFDFWHVASDASLYFPRFVRIKWEKERR